MFCIYNLRGLCLFGLLYMASATLENDPRQECDVSWFQMCSAGPPEHRRITVYSSHPLTRIIKQLPSPTEQHPLATLFIGRATKDQAIRNMLTIETERSKGTGPVSVRLCGDTTVKYPWIVADSSLEPSETLPGAICRCHKDNSHQLLWGPPEPNLVMDVILSRAVLTSCALVVWFWDDFDGYKTFEERIKRWADLGVAECSRPRLLIVHPGKGPESRMACKLSETRLVFSSVAIFREPKVSASWHTTLKSHIAREIDAGKDDLVRGGRLFNAVHHAQVFEERLQNAAFSMKNSFDLIKSTRKYRRDEPYSEHLSNFIMLSKFSRDGMISHIANSMLMDAYPPGAHCKLVSSAHASANCLKYSILGRCSMPYTSLISYRRSNNAVRLRYQYALILREPMCKASAILSFTSPLLSFTLRTCKAQDAAVHCSVTRLACAV
jgi:hypothetical protein